MHESVMTAEVVSLLMPRADGLYVDCTLGFGGHTAALLDAGAGRVIGIDRDPAALAFSRERLATFAGRVTFVHADYRELPGVLHAPGLEGPGGREGREGPGGPEGIVAVDGVLADLGVSSMQLDDPARGFSFRHDGPLDMRMDTTRGQSLAERLAEVDEAALADVIFHFGEERHARRIARAIVQARTAAPIARTGQLASLVRRAAGGGTWQRLDPATRTFQALRIWVNDELTGLEAFLRSAVAALVLGGRLAVIAFHSLEDRVVKRTFRALESEANEENNANEENRENKANDANDGAAPEAGVRGRVLTRKPLMPTDDERARNPRARSARLRAVERVA